MLTNEQIENIADNIIFDLDLAFNEMFREHFIKGMKRYREEMERLKK